MDLGVFTSDLGISNCDSVNVSVSGPGRWRIGGKGDGGNLNVVGWGALLSSHQPMRGLLRPLLPSPHLMPSRARAL